MKFVTQIRGLLRNLSRVKRETKKLNKSGLKHHITDKHGKRCATKFVTQVRVGLRNLLVTLGGGLCYLSLENPELSPIYALLLNTPFCASH